MREVGLRNWGGMTACEHLKLEGFSSGPHPQFQNILKIKEESSYNSAG